MSYPDYENSVLSGPGLFYVNSKITNPEFSTETFTKWYDNVHIPDIFDSGTISNAFRYYSTSPEVVERPYLALYPMEDVKLLQSQEFKSIPVHSKILPDGGPIYTVADFDTRYYTHIRTKRQETGGDSKFLTTVCFGENIDDHGAIERLEGLPWQDVTSRISLYRNYFARQNRLPKDENKLKGPAKYLIIVESPSKLDTSKIDRSNMVIAHFKIWKAFGDKITVFE